MSETYFTVEASTLKAALTVAEKVIKSKDLDQLPGLQSVCFEFGDGHVALTATDRYVASLTVLKGSLTGDTFRLLLDRSGVAAALAALKGFTAAELSRGATAELFPSGTGQGALLFVKGWSVPLQGGEFSTFPNLSKLLDKEFGTSPVIVGFSDHVVKLLPTLMSALKVRQVLAYGTNTLDGPVKPVWIHAPSLMAGVTYAGMLVMPLRRPADDGPVNPAVQSRPVAVRTAA